MAVGESGAGNGVAYYIERNDDGTYTWNQVTANLNQPLHDVHIVDYATAYAIGDNGAVYKTIDGGENWSNLDIGNTGNNLRTMTFTDRSTGYIGGSNSEMTRITDETDRYSTKFYYDELGRLVASQNSEQFNHPGNKKAWSYTFYDELGRIIETGEVLQETPIRQVTKSGHPSQISYSDLEAWVAQGQQKEVTKTFYDTSQTDRFDLPQAFEQENLRTRVASVIYDSLAGDGTYEYGTHYSYDIHGNVKTLLQDNNDAYLAQIGQRFKRIDYEYDLVSGNVNAVHYQDSMPDEYHFRYDYDADNRIKRVWTSKDSMQWDLAAKYFYYEHGPLKRKEIGDNKVQGLDYAYTLQGWIKGVNSESLEAQRDIGKDGRMLSSTPPEKRGQLNKPFARDAAGYSIGYNNQDYKAIGRNHAGHDQFRANKSNTDLGQTSNNLYNGNIKHMATTIRDTLNEPDPQLTAYKYDQLNRIKQMRAYTDMDISANAWTTNGNAEAYATDYEYDAMGNLQRLKRNANISPNTSHDAMDDLEYVYNHPEDGSQFSKRTNRLKAVIEHTDNSGNTDYDALDDIKHKADTNFYAYDAIGNLTRDERAEIKQISWTNRGKPKEIIREAGSDAPDMEFRYGPNNNRIAKIVKPDGQENNESAWITTHYVRDADGNTMAVYKHRYNDGKEEYNLAQQMLYGSERMGVINRDTNLLNSSPVTGIDTVKYSHTLGLKEFEVKNHLGNVLATVSDRRTAVDSDDDQTIDYYAATIRSTRDYYPFGMTMPGRNYHNDGAYRYGFQGQEQDPEIKGADNSYNFGARIHDPRVGRFLSVDPKRKKFPRHSPYQFGGNKPIWKVDIEGKEEGDSDANSQPSNDNLMTIRGQKGSAGPTLGVGFSVEGILEVGPIAYKNEIQAFNFAQLVGGDFKSNSGVNPEVIVRDGILKMEVNDQLKERYGLSLQDIGTEKRLELLTFSFNVDRSDLFQATIKRVKLASVGAISRVITIPGLVTVPGKNSYYGVIENITSAEIPAIAKDKILESITVEDLLKEKKGSIKQEFPEELLDKDLAELEKLAKQKGELGQKARKAKKLLKEKRFDKGGKSQGKKSKGKSNSGKNKKGN